MREQSSPHLCIVGVSHFSDLYPNVKYKPEILAEIFELTWCVHELGNGSLYSNSIRSSGMAKARHLASLMWGHAKVFWKTAARRPRVVYVVYPAVFLVCLYSLMPRRWRPKIVMDAFISLYDTVVLDRALLADSSRRARLLFWLEKRAFSCADVVLVDTEENADYYASFFKLSRDKFRVVPLSIPDLGNNLRKCEQKGDQFRCLFFGSMVPLQGIETVLQAAQLLREDKGIEFVIVGNGQQGHLVEEYLRAGNTNLVWSRQILGTKELVQEIVLAQLCLGIFGRTAKARRVIPYKLYYYAALRKPFISLDSAVLLRAGGQELACPADASILAERIKALSDDKKSLDRCSEASRSMYNSHLDRDIQIKKCMEIFDPIIGQT